MKARITMTSMLVAALCLGSWAKPGDRTAMILSLKGQVQRAGEDVRTGTVLLSGDKVTLAAGSSASILLLNQGKRAEIQGPATLSVGDGKVESSAGAVSTVSSPAASVALSGRNFHRVGGSVVRGVSPFPVRRVHGLALTDGALTWTVEKAADDKTPPPIRVEVAPAFPPILVSADFDRYEIMSEEMGVQDLGSVIPADQGKVWAYSCKVTNPEHLVAGRSLGIRLLWDDGRDLNSSQLVYTRLTPLTQTDRARLSAQEQELEGWARKEPKDTAPYLILAGLYDDKDLLEQATDAAEKALQRNPADRGLKELLGRLYLDQGRYQDALKTLKEANGKS